MESSTPLLCKLSSPSDTIFMQAAEPNFQVDDLLDFPNDEDDDDDNTESVLGSAVIPHATTGLLFASPLSATSLQLNKEETALDEELSYGLCIPPDELVHQLEWLSSFSEDNIFSGGDAKLLSPTPSSSRASSGLTQCKEGPITSHRARDNFRSESPVSVLEHGGHAYALNHHAQRASRIRKARTGGRVWSLDILKPILFENRLKASYENTSLLVTACTSAYSEPLCSFLQPDDSERPYKKIKQASANDATIDSALVRKCTHCSVQKTPQWRAGPLGPKTLCNACGVRYKSGRLVPEYRPAASPSFINEVHSNSHRRILEMRRVKEVESNVKLHKSKVERAHKMDLKRESCIAPPRSLEGPTWKEMRDSKESLSCGVSACKEVELSTGRTATDEGLEGIPGSGITGEDARGREDSIDDGIVLRKTNSTSNETHPQEAPKSTLEKHMPEIACVCNIEAACEAKSLCEKDANAEDMFGLSKCQGHKIEARMAKYQEKDAAYVAK